MLATLSEITEIYESLLPNAGKMSLRLAPHKRSALYCSFCGKEQAEVAYLVAGPTVFICNECVELCRAIGTEMLVENVVALKPGTSR